ncbi:hypothetical protein H6800_03320 [Candidatus Nomurabacteria bacterium]|nr:hypothetical protein [Candidatus Nomurabacteria bacterium]
MAKNNKSSKRNNLSHELVVIQRLKKSIKSLPAKLEKLLIYFITPFVNSYSRFKAWRQADKKAIRYRSFRLQKKIKPELKPLPTSWELVKQTFSFIWLHKKIILGIFLVHLVVYYMIVRAPIQPDVKQIQNTISSAVEKSGTKVNSFESNVVTVSAVLDSTGATQQNGTLAMVVLGIVGLAYIWAIRMLHNGNKITIRDSFYQGMTPIITVGFVLTVVVLELLPFAFASFVYTLARTSGIFVSGFEDLAFFTVTMLIGLLSFYWMTSGIIAVFMVALPGVYPIFALSSARKLVQFQRLKVFRRMLSLPLMLGFTYLTLLVISIRFFPSKTFIFAEIVQLLFVPLVLTYLYKLYRSML